MFDISLLFYFAIGFAIGWILGQLIYYIIAPFMIKVFKRIYSYTDNGKCRIMVNKISWLYCFYLREFLIVGRYDEIKKLDDKVIEIKNHIGILPYQPKHKIMISELNAIYNEMRKIIEEIEDMKTLNHTK